MVEYKQTRVELIDRMGDDLTIVNSARMSFGRSDASERSQEENERLIRYLWWHGHHSPFEMVQFVFEVECPIFVARQIMRHRAFSYNEVSRRYTDDDVAFYDYRFRARDTSKTKQGSGEILGRMSKNAKIYSDADSVHRVARYLYNRLVEQDNVSPETARVILPVSMMTRFYMRTDLRNLFHFLELRMDEHAQAETRTVAYRIATIVKSVVPLAWKAFDEKRRLDNVIRREGYAIFKRNNGFEFSEFLAWLRESIRKYAEELESK